MCLYPTLRENKKYKANKKNGGVIPAVNDERVLWVATGCGECIECRKQKARGWQIRLLEDIKTNKNGKFITLTFSNESIRKIMEENEIENIEGYQTDNEIAIRAVRLFNERWRKKYKKAIRHFLITELGHEGTENIHLHGIIWTDKGYEEIEKIWKYGFIWPTREERKNTYVNSKSVNYIIKYIHKQDEKHKGYKSKILTSAGIGGEYVKTNAAKLNKYKGENTKETYRTEQGYKINMPAYWRNKIYTEEEREKLWIQLLDKNERWVCGEKVRADDIDTYNELIKWHRKRNKALGYGSDEKDYDQLLYEAKQRLILRNKRIQAAKSPDHRP